MPDLSPNSIVVKINAIRLVRRPDSKLWQAHYKIDKLGKWIRVATGTSNIEEATEIAEEKWHEAKALVKNGAFVVSKRFKAVAEMVLRELQVKVDSDNTKRGSNNDYISAINTYLIPFYGNYNVDRINQSVVNDFHIWRKDKVGRELSQSAQANHNAAMNLVLDRAIERGFMLAMQKPLLKNTGEESDVRPDFNEDEIKALFEYMPTWVPMARKGRNREIRELLCVYVGFLAATGMRTGTEMTHLEWRHIQIKETDKEPVFYIALQKGKTVKKGKQQTIVLHRSCCLYLEKLKNIAPELQGKSLIQVLKEKHPFRVFRLSDKTQPPQLTKQFKSLLIDAKLLHCSTTGKERTLYSLRHYAITSAISKGMTAEQLQPQFRTSAAMISKHYNHLDALKNAGYFSGQNDSASEYDAQINRILNENPNDMMIGLAELSTGLVMPISLINKVATDNINNELNKAASTSKKK